jgi:hypothetical protein
MADPPPSIPGQSRGEPALWVRAVAIRADCLASRTTRATLVIAASEIVELPESKGRATMIAAHTRAITGGADSRQSPAFRAVLGREAKSHPRVFTVFAGCLFRASPLATWRCSRDPMDSTQILHLLSPTACSWGGTVALGDHRFWRGGRYGPPRSQCHASRSSPVRGSRSGLNCRRAADSPTAAPYFSNCCLFVETKCAMGRPCQTWRWSQSPPSIAWIIPARREPNSR